MKYVKALLLVAVGFALGHALGAREAGKTSWWHEGNEYDITA